MNIFQTVGAIAIALGTTMAQATIAPPTIVGNTSTYSENFNGGSSFSAGWFNAPFTADDYMWITSPVGSNSSNYSFTSGAAISSLTVSFYYSAFSAQQAGAASVCLKPDGTVATAIRACPDLRGFKDCAGGSMGRNSRT